MSHEENPPPESRERGSFRIEGRIEREQTECQPGDLKLAVYVFDRAGKLLGSADVGEEGKYSVEVRLSRPADVELVVGPAGQAQQVRQSSAYRVSFSAKDWQGEGRQFWLNHDALLSPDIWLPWWPQRICISGHVRKLVNQDGASTVCPVPFVKVEVFDVDREFCWWPWLRNWWDHLLDRPVIRIPELLREPPFPPRPLPGPDPAPDLNVGPLLRASALGGRLDRVALNPQPLPPRFAVEGIAGALERVAINPQPEPPGSRTSSAFTRVGEAAQIDSSIATRLDRLTLTSKIAPWQILPLCFHSTEEVCETTTDCDGYFNCCFNWYPFHFRRGRLRFDSRPDIIIKVTQVINGVSTVIYLDPYTSTRWNLNTAHIDLTLDNEEVVCGSGHCDEQPDGSPVYFTRIGSDEVYQINQTTGLYNDASYSDVAYGSTLYIYGQFGSDLTQSDPDEGGPTPYYYYRLSYAPHGSSDDDFKFIDVTLNDTRVDSSLSAQSHKLGPYTINGVPSLFQVRNTGDYGWYNADWIGTWYSSVAEEDTGKYILRLEMFDQNANKIASASGVVDYRNGAGTGNGTPPPTLPAMTDHSDLVITLDNKRPEADVVVPAVTDECGVIPCGAVPPLNLTVHVSQENNRLRGWQLWYTKGSGDEQPLSGMTWSNGVAGGSSFSVSGAPLLVGLTGTCAFALRLRATAHIRNGWNFIYYRDDIDAIVIDGLPPCP